MNLDQALEALAVARARGGVENWERAARSLAEHVKPPKAARLAPIPASIYSLYGPIHTNTIDGFWSLVKRAIYGQFHHVSRKYLPLYLGEISFRYNMWNGTGAFDKLLHLAVNP